MGYGLPAVRRAMTINEVMLRAMGGEISWYQAAEILDMDVRSLRRWRRRYERHGYDGLLDRRHGTPSPRRAPLEEVERVLRLYRERYRGFNGRHFHETACREHGVKLSYSFVKKALQGAGLLKKSRVRGRHRRRREPRPCFGEMLHLDGSLHPWLALCPEEKQTLVAIVDDATKRLLYARLHPSESSLAVLHGLRAVIAAHGLPGALYTDRAGWAVYTPKAGGPYDPDRLTQVGRALRRLGVEHILAWSPQARGRGERVNRTLQDRLVNELRVAGCATVAAANRYIEEVFIRRYDEAFARAPQDPAAAFVACDETDLEQILCLEDERCVGKDNTLSMDGIRLQIDKQPGRRTCAGLRVLVRRHLDGGFSVWCGPRRFGRYDIEGRLIRPRPMDAAGPVDAQKRAHKNLGRRLKTAVVHSAHRPTTANTHSW